MKAEPSDLPRMPAMDPTLLRTSPADLPTLSPAAVEAEKEAIRVSGYVIEREIGRGGMGVVYRARQTALDRVVALKMILVGGRTAEGDLARFRSEAEAIARLQHPNIVQIHEVGEQNGLPYFSLEFCGNSLDRELNGTPMVPLRAARLVETLARAMQVALTLKAHNGRVNSVAFSHDSKRILTGSADRTVRVWDVDKRQNRLSLHGHSSAVWGVAFSADGKRILTGSVDQTAKVWDAAKGTEPLTLKGHTSYVYSVTFSPDGKRILTGSADNSARVWPIEEMLRQQAKELREPKK